MGFCVHVAGGVVMQRRRSHPVIVRRGVAHVEKDTYDVWVFGMGYCGQALVDYLREWRSTWRVLGVCRTQEEARVWQQR